MNKLEFALDKVKEEAAEVIQAACKVDHFGLWSTDPRDPNSKHNIRALINELDDFIAAVAFFSQELQLKHSIVYVPDDDYIEEKLQKLDSYYNIVSSLKGIENENQ